MLVRLPSLLDFILMRVLLSLASLVTLSVAPSVHQIRDGECWQVRALQHAPPKLATHISFFPVCKRRREAAAKLPPSSPHARFQ